MGLCRDKSVTYLQKFGFNVVRLPSAEIAPLQLIGEYRGSMGIVGNLADLLTAANAYPSIETDIATVQISGQQTSKMPLSLSAAILDGIAARMGAKAQASTAYRHAYALRFEFEEVKRDRVGIAQVGRYLADHEVAWDSAVLSRFLFGAGNLYLIRETLKSKSFRVSAFDRRGGEASIDASLPGDASSVGIDILKVDGSINTLSYSGKTELVFGFIADRVFLQENPVTGITTLGFEPVRAGQVALAGAPSAERTLNLQLSSEVLEELTIMPIEELISTGRDR